MNPFHYHNQTLCVEYNALTDFVSSRMISHYRKSGYFQQANGRGCYGKTVLITWRSIKANIQEAIKEQFGDPKELVKSNGFTKFIVIDTEAEQYFREYRMDDGSPLPIDKQREYTLNASILKACQVIRNNTNARRKAMGGTKIRGIWQKFAEAIAELPTQDYKHSLPTSQRSLQDLFNATICNKPNKRYKEVTGFETLIHGNYRNSNSQKLTEESKLWILSRWSSNVNKCATLSQLHKEYNIKAPKSGWKELKEEKTLYNFLYSEEIKPYWYGHRFGELAYKEKYMYQFSTKLPSMRDALWYSDGTKLNYYYIEDGKMKSCQVYEVMDAFSEVLLGYHISDSENYEAQFNAYKMAAQVSGHRPFQIGMDNQGGHKKLENGSFLSKIARLRIATQPYNGKSKTIENAFGRLQAQYLKQDWFFTGMNITTKKNESKANMEFILANKSNLPTLEEVKKVYEQRRKEWNSAPHPKTGKARLEMYLESTNEQSPKITLADMIDLFWIQRPQTVKLNAYGLTFTEKKVKHTYMKYREDQRPDIEWLEQNIDRDFVIKFDPTDMSLINLYEETKLGLKFVTEMTPKMEVHRAKQEQDDWEATYITKILQDTKQLRVERREMMDDILEAFNELPEQNGLNSPKLKGINSKRQKGQKVSKKIRVDEMDIAEFQKELSNGDINDNSSIYDSY